MLLKFRSPFKLLQGYYQNDNKNSECSSKTNSLISSNYKHNLVVGLRIIVQKPIKEESNKIVVKSAAVLRFRQQVLKTKNREYNSCFLKNCNLCNKRLSLDKDVYMYRYVIYIS